MKPAFKKAAKIFNYLTILLSVGYWIYIIIDDWIFIEEYWADHWLEYIAVWGFWFLVYLLIFSFYYWGIASILILVYYKILKEK